MMDCAKMLPRTLFPRYGTLRVKAMRNKCRQSKEFAGRLARLRHFENCRPGSGAGQKMRFSIFFYWHAYCISWLCCRDAIAGQRNGKNDGGRPIPPPDLANAQWIIRKHDYRQRSCYVNRQSGRHCEWHFGKSKVRTFQPANQRMQTKCDEDMP